MFREEEDKEKPGQKPRRGCPHSQPPRRTSTATDNTNVNIQMIKEEEEDNDDKPGQEPQKGRPHSQPPRRTSTATDPINERDESLPPPKKYRGGFITRASVQQLLQCQSPSSVSTTSLAQLREKLTLLSPILFNKVPMKIAITPELPVLREENEDILSDGFTKRCGVALKRPYHSDTDLTVKTKTRYLAPVIEEPSPSLALVAALGTTDQLVLNKTFDRLYKSNTKFDLADLLVEEALKHGQDKDSGIISGKVYDSDIVEDTPVEEQKKKNKLRLKRNPKDILDNKSTTDDSDVVNDTPRCGYVWRKRGASVRESVNKKDEETLNAEAIYAFFDKEIGKKKVSVNNLVIETDIVDCVNDMIDIVCNDIDVCFDLLVEQQQHIDNLTVAQNIDHRLNDSCKKSKTTKEGSKSTKEMSSDNEAVAGKTVTLKLNPNKQVRKINPTREKKTKSVRKQNNTGGDSVLKDNTNKQSPEKELIRRKRKLYSPKDGDNENNEIPITRKVRRPSTSSESPIAACYIELENAHKSRIRLPRKRASTRPVVSPKTKKLNDMFDSIKNNVVNDEKIIIVSKKSDKDLSLYNLSSESDEEAFQKKKIQVQKRIRSSSLESRSKRKSVKPVNYSSYFSSEDEGERVLKPKEVKQTKPRSRKIKTPKINLIDERMRKPQVEVIETSFVEENIETNISEEPEPALNEVPVLQTRQKDPSSDKKIQVQKRISSSSLESRSKRKSVKPVNYSSYFSSEDEGERVLKPKEVKQTKPRSRKIKTPKINLIDERKRKPQVEVIETSFVEENIETNISEEPEPALNEVPVLQTRQKDPSSDKKIQVQKCISSSSLESRSNRKSVKPVNYSSYFSSEDEGERVLKPKEVKRTKPRSRQIKTPKINLIDERMRKPQLEVLETSFVEENIETNISKEPEPALNQAPVLETIAPGDLHEQPIVSERKIKTPNKSDIIKIKTEKNLIKKCEKLLKSTGRKKIQEINKNVPTEGDSATVSPLPGLVVETESPKDDLTSSIESNLLQKFKKIYTDVTDLSGTQNGNNNGIETNVLSQNSLINLDNYDDYTVDPKEKIQTVDLSNGSEKSIKTVGSSPITGHNNTDESPPNIDALNESFHHRDVHIEGMSKSTTEFLYDMRTELRNSKAAARSTSPVISITRLPTKNSTRSNVCAKKVSSDESTKKPISTPQSVWSNISNPKVVLKRMSVEEIESHLNSSTPQSKATACRVVSSRMPSDEIKKILTPTKSNTTGSALVVLERLSTDEINRWMPMPGTIDVDEDLSEYDSIKTTPKGITARKTSTRSRSMTRLCDICETSKPKISPVKCNFDVDLTGLGARTSLRRTRSCSTVRAPIRIDSSKLSAAKDESGMKSNQESVLKIRSEKLKSAAQAGEVVEISQDTAIISSAETVDVRSKDKIIGSTIDASEISESVRSVKHWFQRNIVTSPSPADDYAARRETLRQEVMEALDTRLIEIHESTSEGMTAAFLKDKEEIARVLQEIARLEEQIVRLKTEIATHQKNQMDRACAIIREDTQKKARLVLMLKEDIQRILK